jgi:CRP-like cAMP-binding protein
MHANDDEALARAIRKLDRLVSLDDGDREALAGLPFRMGTARAGQILVRENDETVDCYVLLAGYACRHKLAGDGGRQIVSFHVPGDILDIQHLLLPRADHNLEAISDVRFARVGADALRRVMRERPRVGEALWRDTLIDASIFREWVLNVGRRDAKARIAHMLCEFAIRREAAGVGSPERFELPMTQNHIADATGLTPIHVNRSLRALSEDGVIARDRRHVEIVDWDRMKRAADFDPLYLHAAA